MWSKIKKLVIVTIIIISSRARYVNTHINSLLVGIFLIPTPDIKNKLKFFRKAIDFLKIYGIISKVI